jgi:hypothetical protein
MFFTVGFCTASRSPKEAGAKPAKLPDVKTQKTDANNNLFDHGQDERQPRP